MLAPPELTVYRLASAVLRGSPHSGLPRLPSGRRPSGPDQIWGEAVQTRPSGRRRGATAVEFAVVAPVMFALVLGIVEVGRAFMVQHLLTDVARDSARYAVVTQGSNKTSDTIKTYATS